MCGAREITLRGNVVAKIGSQVKKEISFFSYDYT